MANIFREIMDSRRRNKAYEESDLDIEYKKRQKAKKNQKKDLEYKADPGKTVYTSALDRRMAEAEE